MALDPIQRLTGYYAPVDLPAEIILADPVPKSDISRFQSSSPVIQYAFFLGGKVLEVGKNAAVRLAALAEESSVVALETTEVIAETTEVAASTVAFGALLLLGAIFSAGDTRERPVNDSPMVMPFDPDYFRCISDPYDLSPLCAALRSQIGDVSEKTSQDPKAIRANAADGHSRVSPSRKVVAVGLPGDVTPVAVARKSGGKRTPSPLARWVEQPRQGSAYAAAFRQRQSGAQPNGVASTSVPQIVERPAPEKREPTLDDCRHVLQERMKRSPLTPRQIYGQTVTVAGQERTLRSVLTQFWTERRRQLIEAQRLNPNISADPLSDDALDVIHYDVTGKLRLRSRWATDQKKKFIPLNLELGQFIPTLATLEGVYEILRLISNNRRVMKGEKAFPIDKDGTIVFYDPKSGQLLQYYQFMKAAHAMVAKAIAAKDYRVQMFGTYDREKLSNPRHPVFGAGGIPVAERNKPFIERSVDVDVVTGKKEASSPNQVVRDRMWRWSQQYGERLPSGTTVAQRRQDALPTTIRRVGGGRAPEEHQTLQPVGRKPEHIWDPRNP